jgi:hypothetical protein
MHPIREGRSPQQIGRKGLSNHRWMVGGKLCLLVNQYGLVVGWACDTANGADNTFQPTFKGVWSAAANFVLWPLLDTSPGHYPPRHR